MKIGRSLLVVGIIAVSMLVIVLVGGYLFHWSGTGFTDSQSTTTTTEVTQSNVKKVTTTVEDQPAKTIWDWLQLLIVPLALAIIAILYNRETTRTERNMADQRYKQEKDIADQRYKQEKQIAIEKQMDDFLQA